MSKRREKQFAFPGAWEKEGMEGEGWKGGNGGKGRWKGDEMEGVDGKGKGEREVEGERE